MALTQRGANLIFDKPTKQVVELGRELPGKRKWKNGELIVQGTHDNVRYILDKFPMLWESTIPAIQDYVTSMIGVEEVRLAKKDFELPPEAAAFPFKTKPFDHQLKAFGLSRQREYFAYFMEMGTGKSKLTIDIACDLYVSGYIDTVIITAPNGVHRQWISQAFPQHCIDSIDFLGYAHRAGGRKKDMQAEAAVVSHTGLRVLTIANESISSRTGQETLAGWISMFGKRALLVVDEIHAFSKADSKRTEFLMAVSQSCAYRRGLSGTPITNGIENLYPILSIMSPKILGHESRTSFEREYCQTEQIYGAPKGARKIIGYQNMARLGQILDGCSYQVLKEDCLDLPKKIYKTIEVPFHKDQLRIYEDMRKYMAAEVEGAEEEITAQLAIVKMTKLRQILGGSIKDDDGIEHLVPTNKIDALLNIVDKSPNGGIVWVSYLSEARRIKEALVERGLRVGVYIGETSDAERERITTKGQVDWLIANDAASTGLDIPWWDLAIYYSNTFRADIRWQSEDRIHRIGQTRPCTYVDLVVPNTLDEVVQRALARKRMVADFVFQPEEILRDTLDLSAE